MCLICMKCGRCPGIDRNADAAGATAREITCLKCGAVLPAEGGVCVQCGSVALVPPGQSAGSSGKRRSNDDEQALG